MSYRVAAWLAWSLCAVSLALVVLGLLLTVLGSSMALTFYWTKWRDQAILLVAFIGAPLLGGLIASHRPRNPYGWLWCGLGLGAALWMFAQTYYTFAMTVGAGSLLVRNLVLFVGAWVGWVVLATLLPCVLLLFPDGKLPSRRWRFLMWPVVAAGAVLLISGLFASGLSPFAPIFNPFAVGGVIGDVITGLRDVGVRVFLITVIPAALSLVFRFRRAGGTERQQIKWLAYAAVPFGIIISIDVFGYEDLFSRMGVWSLWNLLIGVGFAGLYIAVGVAILKHRLYDIDLVINRTLVYGTLTAMLALVYFGGVATVQALFRALTGQEQQPQLAVVVSTLAIAALFNPLRWRVQGFIDRRFYRRKYDAAKTLEAFSAKLRDETDLDALRDDLVGVVRETTEPAHVSLWLRPDTASKGKQAG
jgi:MFS family permease